MAPDENSTVAKIQRLLSRAYHYLGFRMRTEHEMRRYLTTVEKKYNYETSFVESVLQQLSNQGLINDQKFVESYVFARQMSKQKSTIVLKNELLQKGVSRDLLDEYFEKNPQNEIELARMIIIKKKKTWSQLSLKDNVDKTRRFLLQRGFSYDVIQKAIEESEDKE